MYDIRSIDDLIEVLGGPTALGAELGISQEAVSNWKARAQIGNCWHLRLLAMATRRGLRVHPEVFGLSEDEGAGLFNRPLRPSSGGFATA